MIISSTAFRNGEDLPVNYQGALSPPLAISGVPTTIASLAIIFHDPKAVGGDYTHWIVWNINPTTVDISSDKLPAGAVVGKTSAGTLSYVSPHPPQGSGIHLYIFELYALPVIIDMEPSVSPESAATEIRSHALAVATLTGKINA